MDFVATINSFFSEYSTCISEWLFISSAVSTAVITSLTIVLTWMKKSLKQDIHDELLTMRGDIDDIKSTLKRQDERFARQDERFARQEEKSARQDARLDALLLHLIQDKKASTAVKQE